MSVYNFLYVCLAWIFRLVYRVHAHGTKNIPKTGGAVVAPNHTSAMDCVVIAVSSPRRVFYMAKAELFKIPIVSSLLRALGAFPVKRKEGDVGAVKKSIEFIKTGRPLCIFPQGTRCPGIDISETKDQLKSGLGLISYKTEAPIVPVYIKTRKNHVALFRRTDVYYGTPVMPEEFMAFDGRTKYADTTSLVFDRICQMKEEQQEVAK